MEEGAESSETTARTWETECFSCCVFPVFFLFFRLSNFLKGARGGALLLNFLKKVPQFVRICGRGERGGAKRGGGPQISEEIMVAHYACKCGPVTPGSGLEEPSITPKRTLAS